MRIGIGWRVGWTLVVIKSSILEVHFGLSGELGRVCIVLDTQPTGFFNDEDGGFSKNFGLLSVLSNMFGSPRVMDERMLEYA